MDLCKRLTETDGGDTKTAVEPDWLKTTHSGRPLDETATEDKGREYKDNDTRGAIRKQRSSLIG